MTKKELKKIAKEIAKHEFIIKNSEDPDEKYRSEEIVMNLTNKVENIDDMVMLDDLVMEFLEKN